MNKADGGSDEPFILVVCVANGPAARLAQPNTLRIAFTDGTLHGFRV